METTFIQFVTSGKHFVSDGLAMLGDNSDEMLLYQEMRTLKCRLCTSRQTSC